jgi:hypothetical protein
MEREHAGRKRPKDYGEGLKTNSGGSRRMKTSCMARAKIGHLALLFVANLLAFAPARAQQPHPPSEPPPPEHPEIEPVAIEMLKAMGQRLAGAKSMSFTAVTTYESPARNGQPLYYSTLSQVAVQRPNKLRVITPGDGPPSDFYYNGRTMMAYTPGADLVAEAEAPPTIDAAMKAAYDKAAIYFPFAEVIVEDPYKNLSEGLTSAFVVGQSHVVGDTITDIVAITNDNVQAEIWIGIADGLPRTARAIYPKDPTQARYEIQFSNWHLNQAMKDADFTSAEALKAPHIQFARPDAELPGKP